MRPIGKGLLLRDTLIISDLHIGEEEYLIDNGVLLPKFQFEDIVRDIMLLKELSGAKKIVINGDLKHEFGKISKTEWSNTLKLLDYLLREFSDVILIKGNHDTILGPLADRKSLIIKDFIIIGKTLICHGHELVKATGYNNIVIGHQHPAICLQENNRKECFKCHLYGEYQDKKLWVIPSFSNLKAGLDVSGEKSLTPYISDINSMHILVPDMGNPENMLDFGQVKDTGLS